MMPDHLGRAALAAVIPHGAEDRAAANPFRAPAPQRESPRDWPMLTRPILVLLGDRPPTSPKLGLPLAH